MREKALFSFRKKQIQIMISSLFIMIGYAKSGFKFCFSSPAAGSAEGTQENSLQCFADTPFFWTKVKVGLHTAACKWISTATSTAMQFVFVLFQERAQMLFFLLNKYWDYINTRLFVIDWLLISDHSFRS